MKVLCGKECIINSLDLDSKEVTLLGVPEYWNYSTDMIEPVYNFEIELGEFEKLLGGEPR